MGVIGMLLGVIVIEAPSSAVVALTKPKTAYCVVRYESVQLVPSTVVEGTATQLQETIANCTKKVQVLTETVFGMEPCAVLDPMTHQVSLPRRAKVRETSDVTALSCPGTATITTRLTNSTGQLLAQRTTRFTVVPPPGSHLGR